MCRYIRLFVLLASGFVCRPVAAVTLEIYPDELLELRAGPHAVSDVSRQRYFRTYHIPGMYSDERTAELKALGVSPARGTGPYLGSKGGDTNRIAWSASIEKQFTNYAGIYQKAASRYPGATHAMAGGSYPVPAKNGAEAKVQVDATMAVKHSEGFTAEDFSANADLIDRWLTVIREGGGSVPRYFSPLNEPDAAWKNSPNPAQDHADFAKALAIQLKANHPDVLVSGPCTAWPHPDADWNRWFKTGWEKRFIDTAGDAAGAYDFHIYSKEYWAYSEQSPAFNAANKLARPNLYDALKKGNPFVWDFGKADAYLDLVYAYHQSVWGRPSLPVIISEFGRQGITPQLGPWASEYLYYLYGTTVTRMWLGFMARPEIELTVPFILPESDAGYAARRGQAMYTRPGAPADQTLKQTPLRDFYQFFKGFCGERIFFKWQDLDPESALGLFAVAVRNGDEVQVLLHNSFPRAMELKLKSGEDSTGHIARMRWEGDEPKTYTEKSSGRWRIDCEAEESCDLSGLNLAAEETAIVKFICPPGKRMKRVCERFYASQTLQPLDGGTAEFALMLPDNPKYDSCNFVVGVTAPEGFATGTRLCVTVNGTDAEPVDLGFTAGMRCMMVPARIALAPDVLRAGENRVTVRLDARRGAKGASVSTVRMEACYIR